MESSAAQLSSCSPGVLHKERQVSQPRARGKFTLSSLPGNQESSPVGVRSKDWARWEAVSPHVKEDGPSLVIQCQGKAMPKRAGGHVLLLPENGQTFPFAPRMDTAPNQGWSC